MSAVLASAFGEGSIAIDVDASSREEAINSVGQLLVASSRATPEYSQQMLDALDEFGPYFVLAPGIAIAHARPSSAVLTSGLALARLRTPIEFGSEHNDPVSLVFGLCAIDHEGHLDVLAELAMYLIDPAKVTFLLNAPTIEQIRHSFS